MKVKYETYRKVRVQVPGESLKNYYHSDGYVEYTNVSSIEISMNGSLVIHIGGGDTHAFAVGWWIQFYTEDMDEK